MYLCVELEEDKDLDLELKWLAGWVPFQAADPGIWEPAAPTLFFGRWPFHPCTIIFNSYSNSLKFSRSPNGCKEALKLIQAMSIASHRSCHCRLLGFRLLVSVLALVLVLANKPDSWPHFDSHAYSIVPCSSLYSLLFLHRGQDASSHRPNRISKYPILCHFIPHIYLASNSNFFCFPE